MSQTRPYDDITEHIAYIIIQECFPEKNVLPIEMWKNAARCTRAARRIQEEVWPK